MAAGGGMNGAFAKSRSPYASAKTTKVGRAARGLNLAKNVEARFARGASVSKAAASEAATTITNRISRLEKAARKIPIESVLSMPGNAGNKARLSGLNAAIKRYRTRIPAYENAARSGLIRGYPVR
jgi:hypothetical protein